MRRTAAARPGGSAAEPEGRRPDRIAGYGASAEGSTLLNYFKIGPDMVDFVVDRNTSKQGRYTPGTHLKIR